MEKTNAPTLVRVRFAPAPTGHLHLGSLRTALFNWLFARHHNGVFLLRVEDTDVERSRQEYTDAVLDALSWCAITPDEPIVIQSQRMQEHVRLAHLLVEREKAYRCICSKEELVRRLGENAADDGGYTLYDGLCRNRVLNEHEQRLPYVIRFKMPRTVEHLFFTDVIRGEMCYPAAQFDDFIIVRSDKVPTYNFVVVIDDAFMRITHIIRGEEHLVNTPRQIELYCALGYDVPHFAHLALILGPDGTKLSKRDAATAVIDYKKQGFLPDALCNYLARLGWAHGDQEIFSTQELISYFSLEHVSKKGAIFDIKKLEWLNGMYIRTYTAHDLLVRLEQDVDPDIVHKMLPWSREIVLSLVELYKPRVKTGKELVEQLLIVHQGCKEVALPEIPVFSVALMDDLYELLSTIDFSVELLEQRIKLWCAERQINLSVVAQPLRFALTGTLSSPSLFTLLSLVGREETLHRLACLQRKVMKT